jgi:TM2 domain-containing membrane protein YozV
MSMKTELEKYCFECGAVINAKAEICPKCGVRQPPVPNQPASTLATPAMSENNTKWLTLLLLCWFLGIFGVHRFYSGHIVIGVLQLLTLGGCGIWYLIDFILIVSGNYKDTQGNVIKYT